MGAQFLAIESGLLFMGGSALLAFSLCIWFISRIKSKRYFLPILEILENKLSKKPQLTWKKPPLVPFFCFLLMGASVCFLLLQPKYLELRQISAQGKKIHIFIDFSPSVSAFYDLNGYVKRISAIWSFLSRTQHVSISSSHDRSVWSVKTAKELDEKLLSLGFHRGGVHIGSALNQQLDVVANSDQLLIISDQDEHSWKNFNWKYLQNEREVWRTSINSQMNSQTNLYIADSKYLSQAVAKVMDWDIQIARNGKLDVTKGELKVSFSNKILASVPWKFDKGQRELTLRVNWPSNDIPKLENMEDKSLIWSLSSIENDAINIDNIYRTSVHGIEKKVILVAESGSEQKLESPTHELQTTLEVLGIRPTRFEWVEEPGPEPSKYPLWILFVGEQEEIESVCPSSLGRYRNSPVSPGKEELLVWLIPYDGQKASYQNSCWCYHRLMVAGNGTEKMPKFCSEIYDRSSYGIVLRSLGARQVGGDIGEEQKVLAWQANSAENRLTTYAFGVPFRPSREYGISHGNYPIMAKYLLQKANFISEKDTLAQVQKWPRFSDISDEAPWMKGRDFEDDEKKSNVPLGESNLREVQAAALPPLWNFSEHFGAKNQGLKKVQEDPKPWILALLILCISLSFIEIFWLFSQRSKKRFLAKTVVLLFLAWHAVDAKAEIQISLISQQKNLLGVKELADSVSSRTSLKMAETAKIFTQIQDKIYSQPWLWVDSYRNIIDKKGLLNSRLAKWLKRGGFLILENVPSLSELKNLTKRGFSFQRSVGRWHPIPPDHEIMRSFYLIDALPRCYKRSWYGFEFDQRLAIISIPYDFLESLRSEKVNPNCDKILTKERNTRIFINTLMVALTTDYKKDQIHLPNILKRLNNGY